MFMVYASAVATKCLIYQDILSDCSLVRAINKLWKSGKGLHRSIFAIVLQ